MRGKGEWRDRLGDEPTHLRRVPLDPPHLSTLASSRPPQHPLLKWPPGGLGGPLATTYGGGGLRSHPRVHAAHARRDLPCPSQLW
jgi:hypothetical protein